MSVEVYCPPEVPEIPNDQEVIFLAGPVQGASNWQQDAVEFIDMEAPDKKLHIANPRRSVTKEEIVYDEQVSWEKSMLMRAARLGGIVFWLAKRNMFLDYEEGRAYAQTTRIEFGRALGWRDYDPNIRLSIGIEPGYKGSEKYYLHSADEHGLKVHSTLEDTILSLLRD